MSNHIVEICRNTRDGKFCEQPPRLHIVDGEIFYGCPKKQCSMRQLLLPLEQWNTLQHDRLDAARWREFVRDMLKCSITRAAYGEAAVVAEIDRAIGLANSPEVEEES